MNMNGYIHSVVDVFLFLGIVVLWIRWSRPAKEDPRLSRGLQLLQSKISILEDLSDRTDNQVKQMCKLLEKKGAQVQEAILEAKEVIAQVEQSMQESMEVANIFQDKIPHAEIIERESSKKYIEAARLAHQGMAPAEIAKQVDLNLAEIEFIAKVNKDRLMFAEEDLPNWAKPTPKETDLKLNVKKIEFEDTFGKDYDKTFASPEVSMEHLEELGRKFREACDGAEEADRAAGEMEAKIKKGIHGAIQSVLQPIEEVRTAIRAELNRPEEEEEFSLDKLDWSVDETTTDLDQTVEKVMSRLDSLDKSRENSSLEVSEEIFQESMPSFIEAPKIATPTHQEKAPSDYHPHGRVQVLSKEDDLKKNSVLFNKDLAKKEVATKLEPSETSKKTQAPNLMDRFRLRAKEKIQSGELRTKVKRAEDLPQVQQLNFPDIKPAAKDLPIS